MYNALTMFSLFCGLGAPLTEEESKRLLAALLARARTGASHPLGPGKTLAALFSHTFPERKNAMAKTKRQIFYSFHFDNDVMRVQQIRNIGALEDNKPISANNWEEIKKKGDGAIEKWIKENMAYRSCVVVLVGEKTAARPWVKYEIRKAWIDGKGLLGIYIHNLKDPNTGTCSKGINPFDQFTFKDKKGNVCTIKCHNPKSTDAYNDIKNNIEDWVEEAIQQRD